MLILIFKLLGCFFKLEKLPLSLQLLDIHKGYKFEAYIRLILLDKGCSRWRLWSRDLCRTM